MRNPEFFVFLAIFTMALLFSGCVNQTGNTGPSIGNVPTAPSNVTNAPKCMDSDSGLDSSVAGVVTYNGTEQSDSCADNTYVVEYYCQDNAPAAKALACPQGTECKDGACVQKNASVPQKRCHEGSPGTVVFDNTTYSGVCQGAFDILGYYCENDSLVQRTVNCGKGNKCQDGACTELNRSCTDTHTSDKTKSGTVTVYGGGQVIDTQTDSCKNNTVKTGYYCDNNSLASRDDACPAGTVCKQGACVQPCIVYNYENGPSTASTPTTSYTDICVNATALNHFSCGDDGKINSSTVVCDYCSKGRCLSLSQLTCQQTNSGKTVQLKYMGDVIIEHNDTCTDPTTARDYKCISDRMEYETKDCASAEYCDKGSCVKITQEACILVLPGQITIDRNHTKSWVVETNNRSILDVHMDYCLNEAMVGKFSCTETGPYMDTFACPQDEACVDGACVYPYRCVESRSGSQYGTGTAKLYEGTKLVRTEEDTCTGDASKRAVHCDPNGKIIYNLINCQAGDSCDSTNGACR